MPDYIEQADVELYSNVLREIKARMGQAQTCLTGGLPASRFTADLAAVELRIVLELILLGGLVANRTEVGALTTALHRKDPGDARKIVDKVNPGYWPKPTKQIPDGSGGFRLEDINEGFLTSADWGPSYGFVSDQVHARNPYKAQPFSQEPLDPIFQCLSELHGRIVTLLNHHWIALTNRDYALIGMMQTDTTGEVAVFTFEAVQSSGNSGPAAPAGS